MTEVVNLATKQKQYFSLPPYEAVIAAWYQDKGNWNTWEYEYADAPVKEGVLTIACGDFCAFKEAICSG